MTTAPNFFTYDFYERLLDVLRLKQFSFRRFGESGEGKSAYLRHDLDFSLELALKMGRFEAERGVKATYFVMLETEAYQAKEKGQILKDLLAFGHQVGLHYVMSPEPKIREQVDMLSEIIDEEVTVFSVHRPAHLSTQGMDVSQIHVKGVLNVYEPAFFKPGQYISDSNHFWRCGDPMAFLSGYSRPMIQILTHPIWWVDSESDRWEKVRAFLDLSEPHMVRYFQENVAFISEKV